VQIASLKKRLGDILVDVGIISADQLKAALEIQKRTGEKLGTILSQTGTLNEEVMLAFLGKQCGVSYVSLSEYGDIPQNVVHSIPESLIRHQTLIPIAKDEKGLKIAMADPFNVFAVDDIKLMTGYDVQIVIASEAEIKSAIEKHFSRQGFSDYRKTNGHKPSLRAVFSGKEGGLLTSIIENAVSENVSDIHFEPGAEAVGIRFCIDGFLYERAPVQKDTYQAICRQIEKAANAPQFNGKPKTCSISMGTEKNPVELTFSCIPSVFGERIVLSRPLTPEPHTPLEKLGFEPEGLAIYRKQIEMPNGLVLITGPMGSGKTATIDSTISTLNFPDRNIFVIEEHTSNPIPGVTHINTDHSGGFGFVQAIEASLHHNPNILMIEELRDQQTANLAIYTAMTGHSVFSTLTSNDTAEAIVHLNNMGVEPFLTSSTLSMVVAQRLMRVICPSCRQEYEVPAENFKGLGVNLPQGKEKIKLSRGGGCAKCSMTGYRGRIAIFEILEINEELSSLILNKAPEDVIRNAFIAGGGFSLREAAWHKVLGGVSTVEEMLRLTKVSRH